MSRPERGEISVHTEADVNQSFPIRRPLVERLRSIDKLMLNAALCTSGLMSLSLLLTGHHTVGILVAGASATIYGIEWVIERVVDPKK